jgi:hypothetical protein
MKKIKKDNLIFWFLGILVVAFICSMIFECHLTFEEYDDGWYSMEPVHVDISDRGDGHTVYAKRDGPFTLGQVNFMIKECKLLNFNNSFEKTDLNFDTDLNFN